LSPQFAGALRNGFIATGGASRYTAEVAKPDGGPVQWIKWAPGAFLTAVGAPFPWEWRTSSGRFDPMRAATGVESITLLILLPFGIKGAWRSVRSPALGDLALVGLFALFTTALGLIVVNVGTLARLRLPGIYLLVVLAAAGLSTATHDRRETSRP
jgi:hypothetical protein